MGSDRDPRRPRRLSGPDVLSSLRVATRSEHGRLEAGTRLPAAAGEPGHYAMVLRAFLDVVGPLELTLTAVAEQLGVSGLAPSARAELLLRDLRLLHAVGHDPAGASRSPTPPDVRAAVPVPGDVAGVLGCAYVLEGSRLGGATIAPIVESVLGLPAGDGTGFLRGGGVDAGRSWRRFRHEVSLLPSGGDGALDGAADAAVATFRSFRLAVEARLSLSWAV